MLLGHGTSGYDVLAKRGWSRLSSDVLGHRSVLKMSKNGRKRSAKCQTDTAVKRDQRSRACLRTGNRNNSLNCLGSRSQAVQDRAIARFGLVSKQVPFVAVFLQDLWDVVTRLATSEGAISIGPIVNFN